MIHAPHLSAETAFWIMAAIFAIFIIGVAWPIFLAIIVGFFAGINSILREIVRMVRMGRSLRRRP